MSIKRPANTRGAPVRKTAETASARHVDLKPKQQMVPGDVYVGWICKNKACGLVMALASPPPDGKAAARSDEAGPTALKCPHCGDEDLYRWSARGEFPYIPKSVST